jgi:hypothetical protein
MLAHVAQDPYLVKNDVFMTTSNPRFKWDPADSVGINDTLGKYLEVTMEAGTFALPAAEGSPVDWTPSS